MALNTSLKELGLNDKEVRVYLALLKHGKTIPATLARLTKINRATVYSVAKSLQSKGLIAEDLSGKTTYLTPLPPKNLEQLIERPKRELKAKEKLLSEAIRELGALTASKTYPVPTIRFVQEDDIEHFLYENTEKWLKSLLADDGIWWGFQDHSFAEAYEAWVMSTNETAERKGLKFKGQVISNESEVEARLGKKYPKSKREIRFLPGMNFTASVWVSGEYLVMLMTRQQPYYLFEIHDKALAHNMREVLKKLWETSQ